MRIQVPSPGNDAAPGAKTHSTDCSENSGNHTSTPRIFSKQRELSTMGRGGRSAAAFAQRDRLVQAAHILETTPLKDTPTEELHQHAKDRGLKTDGSREDLLIVLHPFSKVRARLLLP